MRPLSPYFAQSLLRKTTPHISVKNFPRKLLEDESFIIFWLLSTLLAVINLSDDYINIEIVVGINLLLEAIASDIQNKIKSSPPRYSVIDISM